MLPLHSGGQTFFKANNSCLCISQYSSPHSVCWRLLHFIQRIKQSCMVTFAPNGHLSAPRSGLVRTYNRPGSMSFTPHSKAYISALPSSCQSSNESSSVGILPELRSTAFVNGATALKSFLTAEHRRSRSCSTLFNCSSRSMFTILNQLSADETVVLPHISRTQNAFKFCMRNIKRSDTSPGNFAGWTN